MAVEFYLQLASAALFLCALVIGFVRRGSEVECIPELCRCVSSEALKLCLCLVERWNLVGNAVLYRAGKIAQRVEKPFILSMTFLTSSALYTAKTRSTKNIASTQAKMIIAAESSSCEKHCTTIGWTR